MRAGVTALVLVLVSSPGMAAATTDDAAGVQARQPSPAPVLPPPPLLIPEAPPRRPLFPPQPIPLPGLRVPERNRVLQAYPVAPGRPAVACGMTIMPALPDVDPKSLIVLPRDDVKYTIRLAPVPVPCR